MWIRLCMGCFAVNNLAGIFQQNHCPMIKQEAVIRLITASKKLNIIKNLTKNKPIINTNF